jgi:uncharacterized protein (TIGR02453 family)
MTTFIQDAAGFLGQLKKNNNRDWFKAHKSDFDSAIKFPADIFCAEVADGLSSIAGFDISGKVFRQHRDVRFSKDKTPYNTHLHMGFFGSGGNTTPGFYFALEADKVIVGGGCIGFEKQALVDYRDRVAGAEGAVLTKLLTSYEKQGWRLDDPELKRVPSGYDKDHERGTLLRRKGLALWQDFNDVSHKQWQTPAKTTLKFCKELKPLIGWQAG